MKEYSIAIDGPAGAGKSTIAKKAAERLCFVYVDTGAMYRAVGLYIKRQKLSPEDEAAVSKACQNVVLSIEYVDLVQQIILNNENVSEYIRQEEIGIYANKISAYPAVRQRLVEQQKNLAVTQNVVMDGRDIGTKVLPEAKLKIYLTADTAIRAERRHRELAEKGIHIDFHQVEQDIIERDYQDINRKESPLRKASDAVLIDSSELSIEDIVDRILYLYKKKTEE